MPTSMTFNTLTSDIQAYLERGTVTDATVYAQIPRLINNAERRISRSLKILGFQKALTNSFTAGEPRVIKPERWRETISFNYGNFNLNTGQYTKRTPIVDRSYEFIRRFWPDDSIVGAPRYFTDYEWSVWLFAPTPDQAYPFEVIYWEMPALLDSTYQQNWISIYAPETLLYSTLLECAPFLKDDGRIQVWQGMFDQGMRALASENTQDMVERAAQTRQQVEGS